MKYACCQAPDCGSTALTAHPVETWDAQLQVFVGEQVCDVCGASVLYRRRPTVTPARCDHKFVDSTQCLKCGWTPP